MKKSILLDLLKLVAIFGAIWLIFIFVPFFKEETDVAIGIDKEIELGEYIVKDIQKDSAFRTLSNPYVDSITNVIASRLVDSMPNRKFEYHIIVFENTMVNAFALPGGYIMVSSGLLKFSESAEQVAGVLAHEMGHVEKRHLVKKLIKEFGLAIVTSGDSYVLGEISRTLSSTGFDRGFEKDADKFALSLLEKSNINPHVMSSFFRKVDNKINKSDQLSEFIQTHPNNTSRMRTALEYKTAKNFKEITFNIDWNEFKKKL